MSLEYILTLTPEKYPYFYLQYSSCIPACGRDGRACGRHRDSCPCRGFPRGALRLRRGRHSRTYSTASRLQRARGTRPGTPSRLRREFRNWKRNPSSKVDSDHISVPWPGFALRCGRVRIDIYAERYRNWIAKVVLVNEIVTCSLK